MQYMHYLEWKLFKRNEKHICNNIVMRWDSAKFCRDFVGIVLSQFRMFIQSGRTEER